MAKKHVWGNQRPSDTKKKKTRQGSSKFSKTGNPGPTGGNKGYRKPHRGQGK